jgi:hypothetical protein
MLSSGNGPWVMAALRDIAIRRLHLAGITQITRVVPCGRADSGHHLPRKGRAGSRRSRNCSRWPGDGPTAEHHFDLQVPGWPSCSPAGGQVTDPPEARHPRPANARPQPPARTIRTSCLLHAAETWIRKARKAASRSAVPSRYRSRCRAGNRCGRQDR